MNEKSRIRVKTPVGLSEEEEISDTVMQGMVEAAITSSSKVAVGIEEAFLTSEKEIKYFDLEMNPQSYVDDVLRLAETVDSAQFGNNAMEKMAKSKVLEFNLEKSNFVIIGNKKARKALKEKMRKNPLLLCDTEMREATSVKFLGDLICSIL